MKKIIALSAITLNMNFACAATLNLHNQSGCQLNKTGEFNLDSTVWDAPNQISNGTTGNFNLKMKDTMGNILTEYEINCADDDPKSMPSLLEIFASAATGDSIIVCLGDYTNGFTTSPKMPEIEHGSYCMQMRSPHSSLTLKRR